MVRRVRRAAGRRRGRLLLGQRPGDDPADAHGAAGAIPSRPHRAPVDVVVEYGVAIADLAKALRRNVIGAIERMTGLEAVEVDVHVNDVHLPSHEITLAADYGTDLRELGARVRDTVVARVRELTDLEPVEVTIVIDDVLP